MRTRLLSRLLPTVFFSSLTATTIGAAAAPAVPLARVASAPVATTTATAAVTPAVSGTSTPGVTRRQTPVATPAATRQPAVPIAIPAAVATVEVGPARTLQIALINADRHQAGLPPLTSDPQLTLVAQGRSVDMLARHYFSHQIPGGGLVFDVLDHQHVSYRLAGENLATNNYVHFFPFALAMQRTNADLMRSIEHRANLLEPKYARVGIGVAIEAGTGRMIVTQVFTQPS